MKLLEEDDGDAGRMGGGGVYSCLSYTEAGKLVGTGAGFGLPDSRARYMDHPVAPPNNFILRHDLDR